MWQHRFLLKLRLPVWLCLHLDLRRLRLWPLLDELLFVLRSLLLQKVTDITMRFVFQTRRGDHLRLKITNLVLKVQNVNVHPIVRRLRHAFNGLMLASRTIVIIT